MSLVNVLTIYYELFVPILFVLSRVIFFTKGTPHISYLFIHVGDIFLVCELVLIIIHLSEV